MRFGLKFADKFCFAAAGTGGDGAGSPGTGAPPPAGGGAAGGGGDAAAALAAFHATIPEDIRGDGFFFDLKNGGDLARKALNQSKMIGKLGNPDQFMFLPAPDDADGHNAMWNRLGRPESADKYELKAPENLPPGLALDAELQKGFAARAHELGITQKQAAGLYEWWNAGQAERYTKFTGDHQAAIGAADSALKTEWGTAYDAKSALSNKALAHYEQQLGLKGGELAKLAANAGPESRGAVAKLFSLLGEHLSEDGVFGRASGGGDGVLSPAEAMQQIDALWGDADFTKSYMNRDAPGHAAAIEKMTKLHEFLTPASTAA